MVGKILSKVTWLGKAVVFIVGLTVIFALTAGMASQSMGATGKAFFELGKRNVANATSTLVKQGPGPALSILVRPGEPPFRVNSKAKVANLNADMVDGLTAEELRGQQGDKGDQGDPGQSVTSETLASGDANCPNGGSKFTSASGETFACTGATGPKGDDGEDGVQGPQGPAGFSSLSYHRASSSNGTGDIGVYVDCPDGTRPVGGGFGTGSSSILPRVSRPASETPVQGAPFTLHDFGRDGWYVWGFNNASAQSVTAYAICAPAQSVN